MGLIAVMTLDAQWSFLNQSFSFSGKAGWPGKKDKGITAPNASRSQGSERTLNSFELWVTVDEDLGVSTNSWKPSKPQRWDLWGAMREVRREEAWDRTVKSTKIKRVGKDLPIGAVGKAGSHRQVSFRGAEGVWRGWCCKMRLSNHIPRHWKLSSGSVWCSSWWQLPGILVVSCQALLSRVYTCWQPWFFYWSLVPPLGRFCLESSWDSGTCMPSSPGLWWNWIHIHCQLWARCTFTSASNLTIILQKEGIFFLTLQVRKLRIREAKSCVESLTVGE